MRLQIGDPAPRFAINDSLGRLVTLADFRDQFVLISFLRNAGCAVCNLRVRRLIQWQVRHPDSGVAMLAIFEASTESIAAYVGRQQASFQIISDPEATIFAQYGVEVSSEKVALTMARPETEQIIREAAAHGFPLIQESGSNFDRIPADFLIGPDLLVWRAHYGELVTDHLPFKVLDEDLGLVPNAA